MDQGSQFLVLTVATMAVMVPALVNLILVLVLFDELALAFYVSEVLQGVACPS